MSEQMIRMMCPNLTCRKVLSVPEVARGKTVRCKQCGTNIRVPMAKEKKSPTPKS
ncbi:MAG: hypothetical protein JKY43_09545 [Phycisphaerales bacterium]|nr:hypothetical protein [Phycisphaerales bacterium]